MAQEQTDDEYRFTLISAMNVALATATTIANLPPQSTGWRPQRALPYPKEVIIDSLVVLHATGRPGRPGVRARVERALGPEEADAVFSRTFRKTVHNALLSLPAFVPDEEARLCSSWEDAFFAKLTARQVPPVPPEVYSSAKRRAEEERTRLRALIGLPPQREKERAPPVERPIDPTGATTSSRGCAVVLALLSSFGAVVVTAAVALLLRPGQ